ncbi:MAG: phosphoribosyltransferase [Proteobacteria bacterium]|nr:phosphoribosyltransferase [Pseudomonadota bacterium]
MRFRNRQDAGRQLAAILEGYKERDVVVLALPRGGVPVAFEIAASLEAPLDLLLVRKLGLPAQPELAMGAVADGGIVIRNEDVIRLAGISRADFESVLARERLELDRRRRDYLGDRPQMDLAGHVAMVVDDGVATGATMRAGLQAVAVSKPSQIVLAVPVAPASTISSLRRLVTNVVCLHVPEDFDAIGSYYEDFRQLTDDDVRTLMASAAAATSGKEAAAGKRRGPAI